MGYAVYHMEKGKSYAGGIGKHIDRLASKDNYNTFKHADPSKKHLNQAYLINEYCNQPLVLAIDTRIKQGYTYHKQIRKDAVRYMTHIMTGSHDEMTEIFKNRTTADAWIQANIDWLSEKYGKENIVRFILHLDEKTPHIHAITVPITKDGGLSAKAYMGNKKDMRELQTDYAKKMKSFSLNRGLMRVGVKHETAIEYYARNKKIDELMNAPQIKLIEPKKSFFKTNINEVYTKSKDLALFAVISKQELEKKAKEIKNLKEVKKEDQSIKDNYQKKIKDQQFVLDSPILLQKRIKEVYKELRDKLEKNILGALRLKLNEEQVNLISFLDEYIRQFAPKKEVNVKNPWEALDIITENNLGEFEDDLYNKGLKMQQEIEQQKQIDLERKQKNKRMGLGM